ncbi:hypothetical protein BOSEA1005_12916 [Hyphomicrobiales bacterium]|nr:hypothetical protein BOSEA1005_12916 [Hyphomicrobiales bacterium]CAI0343592.1 hypothetical protein BO1005MUT1_280094 [Hyphomicrobiales bacterium]
MVQAGLLSFAVVDDQKAEVWSPILPKLMPRSDLAAAKQQFVGWAFRKGSPELAATLTAFVAEHRLGTAIGNDIGHSALLQRRQDLEVRPNAGSETTFCPAGSRVPFQVDHIGLVGREIQIEWHRSPT